MARGAPLRWGGIIAGAVGLALVGFVILTGRTRGLLSSDARYWCTRQFPEEQSFYETRFEPLPFRARGLRVGLLRCKWSTGTSEKVAYVGLPSNRSDTAVVAPALWSRIEGTNAERARAAVPMIIAESIRYLDLGVDESCPIAPSPDGSLRFCVTAAGCGHKWRCLVEPGGSFGCSLRSPVDVLAMCRGHGAKEPIQGHESELGLMITGFPIVPLKGGPSRLARWTTGEITTGTLQCSAMSGENVVTFGWDAAGRIYEGAELARHVRGDVAQRAALASTLLLPPWKACDGSILASDAGEVCGDLYSPNDDDGILEFNMVRKHGADGSEHAPTFAKCRIDLARGRAFCVPKAAHPCPEAKF